ncbi:M16 family metallopeptidase [Chryseobacterium sp.]|uniref:M16 family metallopeptidase n=1 Tax=Chryseobacterium sp. TaxID=1871047 RepID=UPI0012A95945|nr:M16 family metallopeptidase [Chryseobacterium sp.]QFG54376.1 insulinase family protein [Chryseobacterium sp.]
MLKTKYTAVSHTDANGYRYIIVENDENDVRIYTLKNGLQVYLAQNFDAPRIQTYIPVRTGSNNDPADNTGLAHYLEHMMFKGTSKIGTLDWESESALLEEIAELYEQHKAETDPERKKDIYRKIDEVSQRASKFALANEYDKCISALGASGTNAHTWLNETVYKNNIPKNELERWLKIEKERFSELVLRLFHTELESVYEEFNRAQDHDGRLVNNALMELLFPTHQNGQQTTLGKAEHLKNPSMKAIHRYFDEFYVPNNYAMVLVGDLEFNETIRLVDEYFGEFSYRELPARTPVVEEPMTGIVSRMVKSPTVPRLQLAWRTDSYGTDEALLADLTAHILSNSGEAGLLDLHINNAQKALYATAYATAYNEYGYFSIVVVPKEEQTLDEAKELVLAELEKIKQGDFPEWLLPAIINDFKVQRVKGLETADGLATNLYQTYIRKQTWQDELAEMDRYESISKEEIVQFANRFFLDNYAIVYKEKGVNEDLLRVENPGITPVTINRDAESDFLKSLLAEKTEDIQPEFIDYKNEIEVMVQDGVKFSFVANRFNNLAQVHYIFPFGSDHDRELALATQVLQYLGTAAISPDELKQEFYKIGISHEFKTAPDQLTISLTGLEENMVKGVELLHHWIQDALPDGAVYDEYIETILESRNAAKRDKGRIMRALQNYAKFGTESRSRDVVSEQRLREITCKELTDKLKELLSFPHEIFLYGNSMQDLKAACIPFLRKITATVPQRKIYPQPETGGKVYFVDYDMVQTELSLLGRAGKVDTSTFGRINVFNEYFGSGLSSIIFQELRESRSLAYSAYAVYHSSPELQDADYITTYIGTQPDKLETAVQAMEELMVNLPKYEAQFESARQATLKQLASGRVTRTNIFFNHLRLQKLGIDYDLRKDMYAEVAELTLDGLEKFYKEKIQPVKYNVAVMGKRENLDQEVLGQMGTVSELTLDEVFGY